MTQKAKSSLPGLDAHLARATTSVRKRGFYRLLMGGVGAFIVFALAIWGLPAMKQEFTPKGIMVGAIPGGFALVGLMELCTGIPYSEWARRWDTMKGWQRGVLGTLIVLGVVLLLCTLIPLFLS